MYKKIISKMTIKDKADMLTGIAMNTKVKPEFGITDTIEMSDGPSGVRCILKNPPEIEGGDIAFPVPAAQAATWNTGLIEKGGNQLALNCIARGISMILAPGVNIVRSPLCGRNYEYFSEDPYLSGEMGAAYIKGVQDYGVGTSVKHYAANQQENHRRVVNAEISERALREIYLAVFETIVKKTNPTSVMCAYNKVNGHYCSENKKLLTDILRNEWGYDGAVISDWGAVHDVGNAVKAGTDLIMPSRKTIVDDVMKALADKKITEEDIDKAVINVLNMVKRINDMPHPEEKFERANAHEVATEISRESITLLRNDDNILPITPGKYKKIGVVGYFADKPMQGGGAGSGVVTAAEESVDSPLEYIKEYACETEIMYAPLYDELGGNLSFANMIDIQKIARECEVIIMFAGNHLFWEVEGEDRDSLELPIHMIRLAEECSRFCKNTVIVTQTGSAYAPFMRLVQPKAIVQMWFAGEGGGQAIAEVLFGKVNPSGKLPVTFMREINPDVKFCYDGRYMDYKDGLFVGYRYYDEHPDKIWYPFGHGLSYTTFEYSDIQIISSDSMSAEVSFSVTNKGTMTGKEVCQVYVAPLESSVLRPIKELKGFTKLSLNPGETKRAKVFLDKRAFSYYNTNINDWHAESGLYDILVGASSQDIRLTGRLEIINNNEYTINREKWTNITDKLIMAGDE